MNKHVKAMWLAELRDTKKPWVQGHDQLMSDKDEACCLGVVTDIGVRHGVVPPWKVNNTGEWCVNGGDATLPGAIQEWAGLESDNPSVEWTAPDGNVFEIEISMLNDSNLMQRNGEVYYVPVHTFPQIADIIEAQL